MEQVKRGRPALPPDARRDVKVIVSFTADEFQRLARIAGPYGAVSTVIYKTMKREIEDK
jgi:hypothetical protein